MYLRTVSLILILAAAAVTTAGESDAVVKARELKEQRQNAVVTVTAVAKMTMAGMGAQFGQNQEQKKETIGVVVDPDGLVAVPYSNLDLSGMLGDISFTSDGQQNKIEMKTDLADVKIVLADGTEIPATIVLKDADLDLAFVGPAKPLDEATRKRLTSLDLPSQDPPVKVLDEVVNVGRLGKSASYEPTVDLVRVSAVVTKPRKYYFAPVLVKGSPVFTLDGQLLGMTVQEKTKHDALSFDVRSFLPIILPVGELKEGLAQAKAAWKKSVAGK